MHRKIAILIFMSFAFTISAAAETADLHQLTRECTDASHRYVTIKKDFPYKVLHTVQYEGWSGDPNHFALKSPVSLTIRFAGYNKKGAYWFKKKPQKKYEFSAQSDMVGHLELIGETKEGDGPYIFQGEMKNGVIKGLWKKGEGKGAFAFYVKLKE